MEGDGWTKNSDGIWEKGGKTATFAVETLAGNKRRDLTVQVIQSQLNDAGFDMSIKAVTPADLFGNDRPRRRLPGRPLGASSTPSRTPR